MKFSYAMLPDYPLTESLESIRLADELSFHACYAADETWHKDVWLLFAAAAGRTSRIRLGPSVSPVTLREPTLIAQAVATLDELSGGRAEAVLSSGNFGLLAQYRIDWARTRPVRTRVPLKLGAMRGPKSFEAAGELSDGCHHALSYTREAYDYAVRHIRAGAERAGRDWRALDIGAWVVFATGPDSAAAKDPARSMVGIYASSMPEEQLRRNGVDPGEPRPVIKAIADGDLARGTELTTPETAERLSVAGTPEECREKIRREIAPTGVNHVICTITDRTPVRAFTGRDLPEVADVNTQLRLVHDQIMPGFA
ncbi:LLM class flavin-dependent oxidoreductase [Streptomyces poonensis]|uniref:5,10-methylenetetrahydromethanopterin reductase n=1 Tax=Streptomyces poonensis TaxID=68255 RepID=A0A918UDZ7_9ACTN|nr:LLM class flavin-dependent oxidoreductase [Streptomyces poonensis]GGY98816.1 5,10-methylenetetrahydromethanopterin reductase [Streptomyces poonensis]